jgi:hypothetical protein
VLDPVLDTVADDGDHLAVIRDIRLVQETSAPGMTSVPSSVFASGNSDIQNAIESLDDLVDAAAGLHVDERIVGHVDEIARADDVVETKWTTLLPSVFEGTCMMSTGSSLKYSFFCALEYVSSGHASSGASRPDRSARTCARAPTRTR